MRKKWLLVLILLAAAAFMAQGATKISTTGETLSILMTNVEADDKDYNDGAKAFPILARVEELTGVTLKIEAFGSADYGKVLLSRIAAKTDLPDIFVQGGAFDIVKYATDGVIIPIEDLIEADAPETLALWKQFPDIQHDTTAPDGHIYGYPGRVSPYDNNFNILALGYRSDWATRLRIKDPQTIDDWYAMLKAFHKRDPNGNGRIDVVPFLAQHDDGLYPFAEAFGLSPWNDWWSVTKDGKVVYDFSAVETKAKANAWLTEMNTWFNEKLIDQEYLEDHAEKMDAEVLISVGGARMAWTTAFDDWTNKIRRDTPAAQWIVAYPPVGPFGDRSSEQYGPVNNERWMVTTASKNPALAVKWLNFMFATQTGMDLHNWGIEGLSYDVVNGRKVYSESAMKSRYGNGNVSSYLASLGASRWPVVVQRDAYVAQLSRASPEYLARLDTIVTNGWLRRGFYFGSIPETTTESATLSVLLSHIRAYRNEMVQKFIVGAEPLANYDTFVARLSELGIDEVSAIRQEQYDRFTGRK